MSRIVLDACVAIAAAQPQEPSHAAARLRLARVLGDVDEIVVPSLFQVEVASGLTRAGWDAARVSAWVEQILDNAKIVTIGPRCATRIQRVATLTRLRAGDAHYVWLAARENVSLVTSDNEMLTRASLVSCLAERP